MQRYRKWSQDELDLLIKYREEEGLTFEQIADRLEGRTKAQVNTRYNYLMEKNNFKTKKLNPRQKWTDKEQEILVKNRFKKLDELVEMFPERTPSSIKSKLVKLGYSRKENKLDEKMKQFIRDNYMKMSQSQLANELGVDRGVIRRFKNKENLNGEFVWTLEDISSDKDNFMSINIKMKRMLYVEGDDEYNVY